MAQRPFSTCSCLGFPFSLLLARRSWGGGTLLARRRQGDLALRIAPCPSTKPQTPGDKALFTAPHWVPAGFPPTCLLANTLMVAPWALRSSMAQLLPTPVTRCPSWRSLPAQPPPPHHHHRPMLPTLAHLPRLGPLSPLPSCPCALSPPTHWNRLALEPWLDTALAPPGRATQATGGERESQKQAAVSDFEWALLLPPDVLLPPPPPRPPNDCQARGVRVDHLRQIPAVWPSGRGVRLR